jgi:hypothetical protein
MFILFSGFDILHLFYTQTCVAIFLIESCPSNITHMMFGNSTYPSPKTKFAGCLVKIYNIGCDENGT